MSKEQHNELTIGIDSELSHAHDNDPKDWMYRSYGLNESYVLHPSEIDGGKAEGVLVE